MKTAVAAPPPSPAVYAAAHRAMTGLLRDAVSAVVIVGTDTALSFTAAVRRRL